MSRIKAALLLLVLVIGLTGCGGESQDAQETAASAGEGRGGSCLFRQR